MEVFPCYGEQTRLELLSGRKVSLLDSIEIEKYEKMDCRFQFYAKFYHENYECM